MWRDGELIPFGDATIHVLSHAAHRGSEVFDVLRVIRNDSGAAAIGLREHVARFDRSMRLMGMDTPYDLGTIEAAVAETVVANPGAEYVKLVAAWAEVAMATEPVTRRPSVLIAALPPAEPSGEVTIVEPPARVHVSDMPKMPASILPPSLKVAASYTAAVRQQLQAMAEGWDDVIFRTIEGKLAEASTQALLVVKDNRIAGPPFDVVLDSITRRLLIDVAQHEGLTVEGRDIHWDQVTDADELILTSTTHLVRPVGQLDEVEFTAPGPIANQLGAALKLLLAGSHPLSNRWLTPIGG